MNTLRKYLDIISESNLFENPYQGADAAKFAALTPADQEFLTRGGGVPDINDQFILARAPNKGKPAPAPAPAAPTPAATPVANAVAASGQPDDATGVDAAVAQQATTVPPAQSAQPAAPQNRDSMTFGQAFADARKNKEATFTWKGKSYNTELAKPKTQAPAGITATPPQQGMMPAPAPAATPKTVDPANAEALRAQRDTVGKAYVTLKNNPNSPPEALAHLEKTMVDIGAKMKAAGISESESVGYKEDQNLVSIVHLAGLK